MIVIDTEEIRYKLCVHDQRNPCFLTEDDQPPRTGCFCDSCFNGTDRLARALMKALTGLNEAHTELRNAKLHGAAKTVEEYIKVIEGIMK